MNSIQCCFLFKGSRNKGHKKNFKNPTGFGMGIGRKKFIFHCICIIIIEICNSWITMNVVSYSLHAQSAIELKTNEILNWNRSYKQFKAWTYHNDHSAIKICSNNWRKWKSDVVFFPLKVHVQPLERGNIKEGWSWKCYQYKGLFNTKLLIEHKV